MAARDNLQNALFGYAVSGQQAASALSALNRDIDSVAQMAMKSSEGSLLYETKLRDHLALAADIDLAYARPTAAHEAVFRQLDQQVKEGEQKLAADAAQAERLAAANASKESRAAAR